VASLRERNRARTRAEIRSHALRLFYEQGYSATTMEQIASAAEVSQSTLFRYFPTKEDLAFRDGLEEIFVAAIGRQPADLTPIQAIRNAIRSVAAELPPGWADGEERYHALITNTPELQAGVIKELMAITGLLAGEIAARVGPDADERAVRNIAGAVLGVLVSTMLTAADNPSRRYFELIDEGLAHLEAGLPPSDWPGS
jgi:AcrR family transcriptional regulator